MTVFLLCFGIISFVVLGMAVGVIAGREPIKGSCGGLNQFGEQGACEICGGNPSKCESEEEKSPDPALSAVNNFYQINSDKKDEA